MLTKELQDILFQRSSLYVTVATCSLDGYPNAAPKMLVKYSRGKLYFVDVAFGVTYKNLKVNPRLSISFVDLEKLRTYRLKASVRVLEEKRHVDKFRKAIDKNLNKMMVDRVLEGASRGRAHANFIAKVPSEIVIFEAKLLEIIEYSLENIKIRKSKIKKTTLDQPTDDSR